MAPQNTPRAETCRASSEGKINARYSGTLYFVCYLAGRGRPKRWQFPDEIHISLECARKAVANVNPEWTNSYTATIYRLLRSRDNKVTFKGYDLT